MALPCPLLCPIEHPSFLVAVALSSSPLVVYMGDLRAGTKLNVLFLVQANVSGRNAPKPINTFEEAEFDERVEANVIRCKYRCKPLSKRAMANWHATISGHGSFNLCTHKLPDLAT